MEVACSFEKSLRKVVDSREKDYEHANLLNTLLGADPACSDSCFYILLATDCVNAILRRNA